MSSHSPRSLGPGGSLVLEQTCGGRDSFASFYLGKPTALRKGEHLRRQATAWSVLLNKYSGLTEGFRFAPCGCRTVGPRLGERTGFFRPSRSRLDGCALELPLSRE